MSERNERQSRDLLERTKPWVLISTAVGGLAVAAASGIYILSHHVRAPEDAVFPITLGESVVAHIDSSEILAGIAGIGGLVITSVAATEVLIRSRRDEE